MEEQIPILSERESEELHLDQTIATVAENLEVMEDEKAAIDKQVDSLIQQYNPENVDLYNELMVGISLQSVLDKQVNSHYAALTRPYFARIDAEFEDEEEEPLTEEERTHRLYIGRNGITDFDGTQLVTDWRAPVASLYYDAAPGKASYCASGEEFGVDLHLKRTFEIEDGELLDFYDTDMVANDELLIKYLGKNRSAVLSDIVATIQQDQNNIIRESPWKNVIVQGAAGSGKTTVAMHRLAWITYNYRDKFKEDEFYVIGGSKLFLKYITAMLPDLEVNSVCSVTFAEFLLKLLSDDGCKDFDGIPPRYPREDAAPKSTLAFAALLSEWLDELQAAIFKPQPIALHGVPLLFSDDIKYIVDHRRGMSFYQLADVVSERIKFAAANKKTKLTSAIDLIYTRDVGEINARSHSRRFNTTAEAFDEKQRTLQALDSDIAKLRRFYHRRIPKKPLPTLYRQFLGWLAANHPEWEGTAKAAAHGIVQNTPDFIDLCMMLIIKCRFKPIEMAENVRHIIIDEAQDHGASCYTALRTALPKCIFTVMGDAAQNLSPCGLASWDALLEGPFSDVNSVFFNLKKSYRNTIEISRFAARVLAELPAAHYGTEPVIRHGEEPTLCRCSCEEELAEKAADIINGYLDEGMRSVAVVARTRAEAEIAHSLLSEKLDLSLACSGDEEYSGGVTVFPVNMVKGLEFDAVVIWNADSARYSTENAGLLYVALTRAMHKLSVLFAGELTPLLEV
ncbi:MAG: ATP-binding domain-containing protein [Oscillospiraceae bacterium]|nr:ATP-binding domain-containing protein [Oscillospiraceae bacterium]